MTVVATGSSRRHIGPPVPTDHYAESFTLTPGCHFRMVTIPEPSKRGQPTHCQEPAVWRGRFHSRGEVAYRVDAYKGHGDELAHRSSARELD
jgi:hypothetical protein